MRIALVISGFIGILVLGLVLLGDRLEDWILSESGFEWLREQGAWAGLAGAGLIVSDLFLPVPATGVMAALGKIYGAVVGGLYSMLGSISAGLLAYGLVRALGHRAAQFIAGEKGLSRLQQFFDRQGAWAIALTRALPLVPEVLCCLAGLTPMPFSRFLVALLSGSIPLAFVFAGLGSWGQEHPVTTITVACVLPLVVFPPIWWFINRAPGSSRPIPS